MQIVEMSQCAIVRVSTVRAGTRMTAVNLDAIELLLPGEDD